MFFRYLPYILAFGNGILAPAYFLYRVGCFIARLWFPLRILSICTFIFIFFRGIKGSEHLVPLLLAGTIILGPVSFPTIRKIGKENIIWNPIVYFHGFKEWIIKKEYKKQNENIDTNNGIQVIEDCTQVVYKPKFTIAGLIWFILLLGYLFFFIISTAMEEFETRMCRKNPQLGDVYFANMAHIENSGFYSEKSDVKNGYIKLSAIYDDNYVFILPQKPGLFRLQVKRMLTEPDYYSDKLVTVSKDAINALHEKGAIESIERGR